MSSSQLRDRIAAVHAEARAVGEALAAEAAGMPEDELFEVTGELQGVLNAAEGAQLVAVAHAASHETRLTERGPVEVHHGVGFVDVMASSEVSLATGVGQWAAGRRVSLAAKLAERFPRLLRKVVAGELATVNVQKVVTVCDGLDAAACAAVEAVLVDRLVGMDPARVTTITRRVATRVAAGQLAAATAKNKKDRCVRVSPGPDGTTSWWAQLPAGRSAAAWAAIRELGDAYAEEDPELTLDQARADAFLDLLLTDVTVTAKVTLGIPVITGAEGEAARDAAAAEHDAENPDPEDLDSAGTTGPDVRATPDAGTEGHGDMAAAAGTARADSPCLSNRPPIAKGGTALGGSFSMSAAALSGCEVPGIGFIDADTIEALLAVVPTDIGRALLDARTGTLMESVSTAYRPSRAFTDFVTTRDGTCRMWGCNRPAVRCDLDHARPWPDGPTSPANLAGLCRRHHRLKQRRRWTYRLDPDGTVTWTSPTGRQRTTLPDHAPWPPPAAATPAIPTPTPTLAPELANACPPPF